MVIAWCSTLAVMRKSTNPSSLSVEFEIANEPRNVGRSSGKPRGGLAESPRIHMFSSSSSDSRWVNNFKKAKNFSPREHIESFNSRTVFARDPKHAPNDASRKDCNQTAERVRVLRLVKADRWALARRSAASKLFEAGEYVGKSLRVVTQVGSQEDG